MGERYILAAVIGYFAGMLMGVALMLYAWANAVERYEDELRRFRRWLNHDA